MPSLLDKLEARAILHKGHRYLSYFEIESCGLPAAATVQALIARGWNANPEINAMVLEKKEE